MRRRNIALAVQAVFEQSLLNIRKSSTNLVHYVRAGVPALDSDDMGGVGEANSLLPLATEVVLVARLPNARPQMSIGRILTVEGGAVAYPVRDRKPIPACRVSMNNDGIVSHKYGALT